MKHPDGVVEPINVGAALQATNTVMQNAELHSKQVEDKLKGAQTTTTEAAGGLDRSRAKLLDKTDPNLRAQSMQGKPVGTTEDHIPVYTQRIDGVLKQGTFEDDGTFKEYGGTLLPLNPKGAGAGKDPANNWKPFTLADGGEGEKNDLGHVRQLIVGHGILHDSHFDHKPMEPAVSDRYETRDADGKLLNSYETGQINHVPIPGYKDTSAPAGGLPGKTAAPAAKTTAPSPAAKPPANYPDAKQGSDGHGGKAWYIPDPKRAGKYLQVN
jgi:hypothetical protein